MNGRAAFLKHRNMEITNASRMYNRTALLATFHTMSLATFNDTRVKFVTSFFETLRKINEHVPQKNHLPFDIVQSLLLLAVTSDRNMVDQFDKVQATNDSVADIAALKAHILSKASLYDGKDKQVLLPKTRSELRNNQHLQEPADDEEAFYDVEQYSTYQHELADYETATYNAFRTNTSNTPGGRIPDHVWRLMTDEDKRSWASMPHDIRSQIITKQNHYGSGRPPDIWSLWQWT